MKFMPNKETPKERFNEYLCELKETCEEKDVSGETNIVKANILAHNDTILSIVCFRIDLSFTISVFLGYDDEPTYEIDDATTGDLSSVLKTLETANGSDYAFIY